MKAKIYLAILIVAILVFYSIPVIAQNGTNAFRYQSSYKTEDVYIVATLPEMLTFTDGGRTLITELFEFPDFSVINTSVPAPITVFSYDGSNYTIAVSHEEAWAHVLYEIDRIAWEFIANNPEFVAYIEMFSAEDDDVTGVQPFFLPVLSPDMHMARDLNQADGMSLANRTLNLTLGWQALERATDIYPNDACRRDTLRHFTWARSVAQAFGVPGARMATNNHEWANAIGAHFGRQDYRNSALTILRRQALYEIASVQFGVPDQSIGFIDVFDDENVHDFWNNRAGINSINDGITDPVNAFRAAEARGDLIMSDRDVTQSQTMDIFYSRWPFHNMYLPDLFQVTLAGGGGTWATAPAGWDGVGTAPYASITRQQIAGSAVTWPANPVCTGYVLTGWTPARSGTWPVVNTIYTAQWQRAARVITFDPRGGTWPDGATTNQQRTITQNHLTYSTVMNANNAALLNVPLGALTRSGYAFLGWFEAPTGGMRVLHNHNAPAGSHTLYAQWERTVSGVRISTLSFFFLTERGDELPDDSFVYVGDEYDFVIFVRAYLEDPSDMALDVRLYKPWPEFMGPPRDIIGANSFEVSNGYVIFNLGDLAHGVELDLIFSATAIDEDMQDNLVQRLSPVARGIASGDLPNHRVSTLSFFFLTDRDDELPDDSFVYVGDEYDFVIIVRAYPGVGNVAKDTQLFKAWPTFLGPPRLIGGANGFEIHNGYVIFCIGDLPHGEKVFVVFAATAIGDDMQDNLVMRLSTAFQGS